MKRLLNCIIFIAFFVLSQSGYAATIQISPENVALARIGDTFEINIVVEQADRLGAAQFILSYDPEVVMIKHDDNVAVADFLGSTGRRVSLLRARIDNASGKLNFAAFSFGRAEGPSGSGILASITFTVIGQADTSLLTFDKVRLTDTQGLNLSVNEVGHAEMTND